MDAAKIRAVAVERAKLSSNRVARWKVDDWDPSLAPYKQLRCVPVSLLSTVHASCEKKLEYELWRSEDETPATPDEGNIRGHELHMRRALELDPAAVRRYELSDAKPAEQYASWVRSMGKSLEVVAKGGRVRSIILFGYLPNIRRVVFGTLDELEMVGGVLCLRDFRTRVRRQLPTGGLMQAHMRRVRMIRYMFDRLVTGSVDVETICSYWEVDPKEELEEPGACLGSLLRELFAAAKALPRISLAELVYAHQADGQVFGKVRVGYSESLLLDEVERFSAYWSGERRPVGVEIEDAWKVCPSCSFVSTCDWKHKHSAYGTDA